jgi:hypothetical protein
MSSTPMAPSALDFLVDDHDLTASVLGARFVRAGTAASLAAHPVPEATPALSSPGAGPWSPGSSSAAHGTTSTPPSTSSGAVAPVHPAQVAASGTTPTTSAAGPAPPAARAQVVASGTGHTAATRLIIIPLVTNAHSMRTRGKAGIAQPVDCLNLHVVPMSPLPRSVCDASSDPNWRSAMQAEYDTMIANDTWSLVPRPPGVNVVTGK